MGKIYARLLAIVDDKEPVMKPSDVSRLWTKSAKKAFAEFIRSGEYTLDNVPQEWREDVSKMVGAGA